MSEPFFRLAYVADGEDIGPMHIESVQMLIDDRSGQLDLRRRVDLQDLLRSWFRNGYGLVCRCGSMMSPTQVLQVRRHKRRYYIDYDQVEHCIGCSLCPAISPNNGALAVRERLSDILALLTEYPLSKWDEHLTNVLPEWFRSMNDIATVELSEDEGPVIFGTALRGWGEFYTRIFHQSADVGFFVTPIRRVIRDVGVALPEEMPNGRFILPVNGPLIDISGPRGRSQKIAVMEFSRNCIEQVRPVSALVASLPSSGGAYPVRYVEVRWALFVIASALQWARDHFDTDELDVRVQYSHYDISCPEAFVITCGRFTQSVPILTSKPSRSEQVDRYFLIEDPNRRDELQTRDVRRSPSKQQFKKVIRSILRQLVLENNKAALG